MHAKTGFALHIAVTKGHGEVVTMPYRYAMTFLCPQCRVRRRGKTSPSFLIAQHDDQLFQRRRNLPWHET